MRPMRRYEALVEDLVRSKFTYVVASQVGQQGLLFWGQQARPASPRVVTSLQSARLRGHTQGGWVQAPAASGRAGQQQSVGKGGLARLGPGARP